MNTPIQISLIIPVYNRPQEVEELLASLSQQIYKDFEIIIVEDGSSIPCQDQVKKYQDQLDIKYYFKPNSGPGQSRNYGFEKAKGNYGIFLDSDCVIPDQYTKIVHDALSQHYIDAFGGPDQAHPDFSDLQKAINYSMTSFFTTGGIRGGSEKLDKFYPRSFNMGYSRAVFTATHGFSKMRFGEDIDMSIRILDLGFQTQLIKQAYVFHKRRTNLRQFFKQVFNSGIARINLYKRHPQSLKIVHFAPAIFTIGVITSLLLGALISPYLLLPLAFHAALIFLDSSYRNRSPWIGLLSILTSYVQLFGYGTGFIISFWKRIVLRQSEFSAFGDTFYK